MNEKTKQSLDTAKAENGSLISKKDFMDAVKEAFSPKDPLPKSEPTPDDFDNPYLGYRLRQSPPPLQPQPFLGPNPMVRGRRRKRICRFVQPPIREWGNCKGLERPSQESPRRRILPCGQPRQFPAILNNRNTHPYGHPKGNRLPRLHSLPRLPVQPVHLCRSGNLRTVQAKNRLSPVRTDACR